MNTYKQTVKFERHFEIQARSAEEANAKLMELVHDCEFGGDVEHQGYYDFEDEPVECPECKGACVIGEQEETCKRCNGDGVIAFQP